MKRLLWVALWIPLSGYGQMGNAIGADSLENGVHFEALQSWQQILAKARQENKYIFVDCYATWCGPCKEMDRSVYPLESVGAALNPKFISVRMQMDSTAGDNEAIKAAYADVHALQDKYKLTGYPTFLFFTPDGKILNRDEGLKSPEDFIRIARETSDPARDYYRVYEEFQAGKTGADQTSWLARQASLLGYTEQAAEISRTYIARLKGDSLFTKANIEFMNTFTSGSAGRGFRFFYREAKKIDSVMDDDQYAEEKVQNTIFREIVQPVFDTLLKRHISTPDWEALHAQIGRRYNRYYADRLVLSSRCTWASHHNQVPEYVRYLVRYQDLYGSKTSTGFMPSMILNNYAWEVFKDTDNPEMLRHALVWSGRAVLMAPAPNWMDTYANLLYKLNQKETAIHWEELALKIQPANKLFLETLEKMKKGEPTWPKN